MKDKFNLVGQKFGKWTVLEYVGIHSKQRAFLCECECGRKYTVTGYSLRKGKSSSCKYCANRLSLEGCGYKPIQSKFEELMSTWDNKTQDQKVVKLPVFGGIVGKEYIKGFTLIDAEDWDNCSKIMWTFSGKYIVATLSERNKIRLNIEYYKPLKNERIWLHRQLLGLSNMVKDGTIVDHINGDPTDNRKINLRLADYSLNTVNAKPSGNNKYKGVYTKIHKNGKIKYRVSIMEDGVSKKIEHLGYFDDEIEAAKTYDEAARKLYKDFARLNFPNGEQDDTQ